MKTTTKESISIFIMGMAIGGAICGELGRYKAKKDIHKEAIQASVAQYVTDKENGTYKFEWITK